MRDGHNPTPPSSRERTHIAAPGDPEHTCYTIKFTSHSTNAFKHKFLFTMPQICKLNTIKKHIPKVNTFRTTAKLEHVTVHNCSVDYKGPQNSTESSADFHRIQRIFTHSQSLLLKCKQENGFHNPFYFYILYFYPLGIDWIMKSGHSIPELTCL